MPDVARPAVVAAGRSRLAAVAAGRSRLAAVAAGRGRLAAACLFAAPFAAGSEVPAGGVDGEAVVTESAGETAAGITGGTARRAVETAPVAADIGGQSKTVDIRREDAEPVIDGVLDEDVWERAAVVRDLHQLQPVEYAAPSQSTEVRIFYSPEALYVAARLWDSEADRITAHVLRQGDGLGNEDRFSVVLDPYLDRRNGYKFQVNANGVRWEALYQNTSDLQSNWDGIWQGAATRDPEGWTAEMRIPFKTLSFDPDNGDWGINFERTIQRNDETLGWVSRNRQLNPGVAGIATGFRDLEQGMGLDIAASASIVERQIYGVGAAATSDFEPSLDVFYKITPSLNGALTINTDFSATEVDDRQVNLTRFGLFFPEKRDFFLQDADIFEFGGIGGAGRNNPAVPNTARENGRPFFSRRLGLSGDGEPVDLDYGGKLSGRIGRWNLGGLAIRQTAFDGVGESDVFVGRASANVLEESAAGLIVTDGDPQSDRGNSLIGADFRYRNTRLPGGRQVEGLAWYQQTDTPGLEEDDRAFGLGLSMPNNTGWRGAVDVRQIDEHFNPAVGFVNNAGVRDYSADFGYRARFDPERRLRSIYGGLDAYRAERLAGGVQSESVGLRLTGQGNRQDRFFSRVNARREVLTEDFEIYSAPDGSVRVVIPAGDYTFTEYRIGAETGRQRRLSGRLTMGFGEFYGGDRRNANVDLNWRPSEHFQLGVDYRINEIALPEGDFTVRLASMRAEIAFSSTLSWVNLVQYDNVSETAGINSRLHWIPEAGREGFIVLNHNLADADRNGSFHSTSADASVKFSYTWRF